MLEKIYGFIVANKDNDAFDIYDLLLKIFDKLFGEILPNDFLN